MDLLFYCPQTIFDKNEFVPLNLGYLELARHLDC